MPLSDLIAKPWPVLVTLAEEALQNQDLITLQELDGVLRDRFIGLFERRESAPEFVSSTLAILASPDAADQMPADEAAKLLAQWELLLRLAEGVERTQAAQRNAVERHVTGRPRRQQILDIVHQTTEILFKDLKAKLGGVSDSNLSGLLGELEAHAIVERERRGTETWVRLGSAGVTHFADNPPELTLNTHDVAIGKFILDSEQVVNLRDERLNPYHVAIGKFIPPSDYIGPAKFAA